MKSILTAIVALILLTACEKQPLKITDTSIYNIQSNWETPEGKKIKLESLKGKVVTLVMIYTSCRTACPKLTQDMKNIEAKVGEKDPNNIQYVLVSIDPKTDTPERMKAFIKNNSLEGKQWLFLRGTEQDTRELANVLAVKYKQISPIDFSHSNIISVFSKTGDLAYQKEGLTINIDKTVDEIKNQLNLN